MCYGLLLWLIYIFIKYYLLLILFSRSLAALPSGEVDDYNYDDDYSYSYNYNSEDKGEAPDSYDYQEEEEEELKWPQSDLEEEEEVEVLQANPQFETKPLSLRVELGHTVRLPCRVDRLGECVIVKGEIVL